MPGTEQLTNMDPAMGLTWHNFEAKVAQIASFPWNKDLLKGLTPAQVASRMKQSVGSGFGGIPKEITFTGSVRFFRGVGPKTTPSDPFDNNAFGGWWFQESDLHKLEAQLARIFFTEEERRRAFRDTIRAGLAIAYDWNKELSEYWMLDLPAGAKLTGLTGRAKSQPQHSAKHPQHDPNKTFPGGLMQIYFPVKNPLWVRRYV